MYPIATAILLFSGLALFAYSAYRRALLLWLAPESEKKTDNLIRRLGGVIKFAFAQLRLLRHDGAWGLMHAFIFWGFLAVAIRTITLFGMGFSKNFELPLMGGVVGNLYSLIRNIFEVLVLLGVCVLLLRRMVLRPKRITLSYEANLILAAIGTLMITDFAIDASKFQGLWFTINYFAHIIIILGFLNYLPYGKHFHIITSIPNVFFRKISPALSKMNLEDENAATFGTERINELNWKQRLDLYSCTECGRCEDQCPAYATDKPLSPKKVIMDLRNHLYRRANSVIKRAKGPNLVPDTIHPDVLWACTTCRACETACPVFIEVIDKLTDLRRNLVLMRGDFAPEAQTALKNIETNSNPWGIGGSTRADWAKDLGIKTLAEDRNAEYLYFVGCAGSFDERAKKVSRAFARLLQKAHVSFGILGTEEKCTGDSARRIGNEYLFQILAKENIKTFTSYGVKKILTTCPHCYNTIKNEFPHFGGNYEIYHHTEFLLNLIKSGKLNTNTRTHDHTRTLVYHDSCYLGRYNSIYEPPREILKAIPNIHLKEAKLSCDIGRCCGAGGGRMWMEEKIGTRVNHKRLEDLQKTTANTIATACPFCLTMLSDAVKDKCSGGMDVLDIAEILWEW